MIEWLQKFLSRENLREILINNKLNIIKSEVNCFTLTLCDGPSYKPKNPKTQFVNQNIDQIN